MQNYNVNMFYVGVELGLSHYVRAQIGGVWQRSWGETLEVTCGWNWSQFVLFVVSSRMRWA